MKYVKSVARFVAVVVLCFALILGTGQAPAAQAHGAPPTTVVYNLFATDGYIELADGDSVFTYGFVGGRQGVDYTYQPSYCTGDGLTRNCALKSNITVAGGPPAPTGGPVTAAEAQFAGNAQFPAPLIYASVGDIVEIRLKNLGVTANPNAPNDPHSIHLHGLDVDAANDGVPETSIGAIPANLGAPGSGNVVVYMYNAKKPGTAMYHCHQEADIHVNMGMFGALVTYNRTDAAAATGPGAGAGGDLWGFQYDKDYVLLLSEIDIRGHADEEGTYDPEGLVPPQSNDPFPYNWAQYMPQYWFINGLSFPQTIHAGFPSGYSFGEWVAAHPGYDPLITGSVSIRNNAWRTKGQKVLIRVINMGFETQPMHMHGYHGKVLGSDQRVWDWANVPASGNPTRRNYRPPTAFGSGLEKNTLLIGSGETYEWLVDFGQQSFQSTYAAGTQSCYDTATGLPVPNAAGCSPIPVNGDPSTGSGYVGGPTVTGLQGSTAPADFAGLATNQYFPFHNHDDYKATNNGTYPGGMFTMLVPTP